MISFQPSENNFEMKIQNSYHRYRGATMRFSEARHSEGNIRALRKSQPLIKVDPSCWTDIRLHRRLTPNIGVCYFYLCKQILIQGFSNFRPFKFFLSNRAPVFQTFNQSQYCALWLDEHMKSLCSGTTCFSYQKTIKFSVLINILVSLIRENFGAKNIAFYKQQTIWYFVIKCNCSDVLCENNCFSVRKILSI